MSADDEDRCEVCGEEIHTPDGRTFCDDCDDGRTPDANPDPTPDVNPTHHYEVTVRVVVDPAEWTERHVREVVRDTVQAGLPSGRVGGVTIQGCRVHAVRRTDDD